MKNELLQMLRFDHILSNVEVSDWQQAVQTTGEFMRKAGLCTEEYIEAMIDLIQEYGPYLVIAPGIALLHARPDKYILKPGLVLITLKTPICFGHSENDPVWLLIGLAASDNKSHVDALAELAILLSEEGIVEKIKENSHQSDVIFQIIQKASGKKTQASKET